MKINKIFMETLMTNQPNQLNLANLFKSVAGSLTNQRENLNNADTYNHDHGDNMVEVFNVISQAMQAKKNADPADQLAYASQLLRQRKSGSAQVYAQGLSQASNEFKGQQQLTPDNAINLIQALMGGGQVSTAQPQSGMGDLLGSLLGGGNTTPQQSQSGTGDLFSMLLGEANTKQAQPQEKQATPGIDVGDLLNAGMAFMNTKSQGGNNLDAIVNALVSGSAMGNSLHRSQSGTLVVNSLLKAISGMSSNK
jgi:hypothetical protein